MLENKKCNLIFDLKKFNAKRKCEFLLGFQCLPNIEFPSINGKNGEELASDEAAIWKRVLNYRLAKFFQPFKILETHKGKNISTILYKHASNKSVLLDHNSDYSELKDTDFIDIDPFGQPWETIEKYLSIILKSKVVLISNGEAYAVCRNWKRAQKYPTKNYGRNMPIWIRNEYIPKLEEKLKKPCRFFYAFPTTIRSVHTWEVLPDDIFEGCPQWMWWLEKYS